MIKKNIKNIASTLFLVFVLCVPYLVLAETMQSDSGILGKVQSVGTLGGYAEAGETSLAETLGLIVNTALSLLGVVFIVLMVYGGFQWMTAGGNEEQVKKAQGRIKNAIIGLVITIAAYAIWMLINEFFIKRI
jgi:lysylphosphatidylglycerol synthetase-like protein (DUF2156 family)